MKGKIVCLEGIIGAGKSTQVQLLAMYLRTQAVVIPELNTVSPLKEVINYWKKKAVREQKICFSYQDIRELAEARAETQNNILSILPSAKYILSDRSVYTSLVYESGELSFDEIRQINKSAGVIFPDFGFILDCDPLIALSRIDERRQRECKYNGRSIHENLEELFKRRALYLTLQKQCSELILIDSTRSSIEVAQMIMKVIKNEF